MWSSEAVEAFERLTFAAEWRELLADTVAYETRSDSSLVPVVELIYSADGEVYSCYIIWRL